MNIDVVLLTVQINTSDHLSIKQNTRKTQNRFFLKQLSAKNFLRPTYALKHNLYFLTIFVQWGRFLAFSFHTSLQFLIEKKFTTGFFHIT